MIITQHSPHCIKIQFGDTVLVFNPPSKESKEQSVRFSADVVFSSIKHPDFFGTETISPKGDSIFLIDGPGEYEVKGVFVKGFASKSFYDGGSFLNTIYTFKLEDITVCVLGALGEKELPQELLENLDDINILFVPINGEGVLDPMEAYKLGVKLAPNMIIPTLYKGEKDPMLQLFFKEEGIASLKSVDKVTVKKKEVEAMEGEIVTLSYPL